MIASSWFISVVISLPALFLHDNTSRPPDGALEDCIISQNLGYTVFSTVSAFYLPFVLMIIVYIKVFRTAQNHIRKKRFKAVSNRAPTATGHVGTMSRITVCEVERVDAESFNEQLAGGLRRFIDHPRHQLPSACQHHQMNSQVVMSADQNGGVASNQSMVTDISEKTLKHVMMGEDNMAVRSNITLCGNDIRRQINCIVPNDITSLTADDVQLSVTTDNHVPGRHGNTLMSAPSITTSHYDEQRHLVSPRDDLNDVRNDPMTLNKLMPGNGRPNDIGNYRRHSMVALDDQAIDQSKTLSRRSWSFLDVTKQLMTSSSPPQVTKTSSKRHPPTSSVVRSREQIELRRERKAARTLAIITGTFILCWLPFFILALLRPFCGSNCHYPDIVVAIFGWLGYVNSLLNPIIYTVFNPDFRTAFSRILFGRYSSRSKRRIRH